MRVFLNGRMIDRGEARLSAFDAGTQHGVGLFETLLARSGPGDGEDAVWVPWLAEHTQRLAESARVLGLSDDLRATALGDAVLHAARVVFGERPATTTSTGYEPPSALRIRLTVTGGDLNFRERATSSGNNNAGTSRAGTPEIQPTVLVDVQPATVYPEAMFERGIALTIADARANPFDPTAGHKTLNYWWRLRELQAAAGKGAGEALVLQVSNHLAGGCVSNLVLVKDGALVTPIACGEEAEVGGAGALPSPVLPGVVRGAVLAWADEQGMAVERKMLGVADLLDADEAFLTNSSWGVLPVVRVERETIGSGEVGELTRGFIGRWRERLARG